MSIELRLLLSGVTALLLALTLTPIAIRVARRLDFYDRPAGYKEHGRPTPYLGGTATSAAVALSIALFAGPLAVIETAALVAALAALWLVGTIDDRRTVSPLLRVAVEGVVAVGLWAAGLGWDLNAGAVADIAVTVAWVVCVVNAVNLFDNLDGAANAAAASAMAGVAALGLVTGDAWVVAVAAAGTGATAGFLRFNLASPARIFLGDGGSMPLGLLVAVATSASATNAEPGAAALAIAVLLTALPLLDTTLVVISRRRRGVSFLTGGRDHLSHRILARVRTPRRVAAVVATSQLFVSGIAIAATELGTGAPWAALAFGMAAGTAAIVVLERESHQTPHNPAERNDRAAHIRTLG